MTTFANRVSDAELVTHLDGVLADPGYVPDLYPPGEIARMLGISRAAVTNWGARTERTGVRRYGRFYDLTEAKRWLHARNELQATRRRVRFTET